MKAPLYATGITQDGRFLVGGIWRLYHQQGFPLELAKIECEARGQLVDWCEAMADASLDHNLPALMAHLETFLDAPTITALKVGFMGALSKWGTYAGIMSAKQTNAAALNGAGALDLPRELRDLGLDDERP